MKALITIFVLLATSAHGAELTRDQVIGDLRFFRDVWASKDRSFDAAARKRMLAFIDDKITNAPPMDKAALALVFSEAAAFSGNNHTLSEIDNAPGVFHPLPISFWWFPEGAIVTRAHPDDRRLLGARILSIGGIPVEQAAERTERFTPGIETHKRYLATRWLTRIEALQAIGVTDADGTALFEFMLPNGTRAAEKLGAVASDPAVTSPPWRSSMVPGKGPDPWPHVLDDLKDLPLYVRTPDTLSWSVLRNGDVLYVRSTDLSSYSDDPFEIQIKAYQMVDSIVKSGHLPAAVIVDLRYNEGGNFFNVINLSTELVKMTAPSGRIYVITGQATNSAAIAFVALLKAGAPKRTTIAGETMSDRPWFWSEGGFNLKAPASGLRLRYTDAYHDWANGCTDLHSCYWPVVFHGVKAGPLQPTLPVTLTYTDYVSGEDTVLNAILADIDREVRSPAKGLGKR